MHRFGIHWQRIEVEQNRFIQDNQNNRIDPIISCIFKEIHIENNNLKTEQRMEGEKEEISANEFQMVARSKKEAYDVLASQGLYYLPPIESTRADFVADVIAGSKNVRL